MKKTLHGKSYLRSRSSVMIGRNNKIARKLNRMTIIFSHIDWNNISKNLIKALTDMAYYAGEMISKMEKVK